MIGEPRITVDCDDCGEEHEFEMTSLAMKGVWDTRNLGDDIKKEGWIIDGDKTYCSDDCYRAANNQPELDEEDD